jgi:hypothetical protein
VSGLSCVLTRSPRTKAGILAVPFYFQAGPIENFGYDSAVEFTDYDTLGGRRFSRPISRGLTQYAFDTLFTNYLMADIPAGLQGYVQRLLALGVEPGVRLDPISTHPFFAPPLERLRQLRVIQDAKTPMVLTMADSSALVPPTPVNLAQWGGANELSVEVTLRNIRQEERAGEIDAIYVQVTFVEFGVVELKRIKRGGKKGDTSNANGPWKVTILTMQNHNCTIARCAKWKYGDASKTAAIFSANPWLRKAGIGKNENLRALAAGDVRQTTRTIALKKLLKKHRQIIIPVLKTSAATTKNQKTSYIGSQ